ncbi:MAG: hypothetical protein R3E89_07745 [Thiolinea sp.]
MEARIGLNAAQFRRVIVLPQGRFRQLLLAGSSEREAIFSRLFQTHAYQLIEERLQEQASALSREATQLRQHQEYLLAGLELADQAALQQAVSQQEPRMAAAQQQRQQARQRWQQQQEQRQQAQQLLTAFTRLAEAEQQLAACQAQQAEHEQQQTRLQAARQAAQLSSPYPGAGTLSTGATAGGHPP